MRIPRRVEQIDHNNAMYHHALHTRALAMKENVAAQIEAPRGTLSSPSASSSEVERDKGQDAREKRRDSRSRKLPSLAPLILLR